MDFEKFSQQVSNARTRVITLQQQASQLISPETLLNQAFDELLNATNELQTAQEELHWQIDEIAAMREIAEQERQQYRDLFEFAPDGYIVTNIFGKIKQANRAAAELFNLEQVPVGRLLTMYILHEDRPLFRQQLVELTYDGPSVRTLELRIQRHKQPPIPVVVRIGLIYDSNNKLVGLRWLLRDISARKHMEDALRAERTQLQRLSQRLVEVQEAERRAIACELHDELGQMLTGLKFMLEMPRAAAAQDAENRNEALSVVKQLIEKTRNLSLDLRPTMLDDLGLLPALLWHFERYTKQTHIQVCFSHQGMQQRFSPQIETTIYRVVQEALTNAARYANVRLVNVTLSYENGNIRLEVLDHGTGFDTKAVLQMPVSNGLTGIRERVLLLGGQLELQSTPGMGTSLLIELPADKVKAITA